MIEIPTPSCCCAARDERASQRLAMLQRLSDMGMDLAEKVHAEAMAEPADGKAADHAMVFARISRAVRQTLALEARLASDHQADRERARDAGLALARRARKAQVTEVALEAIKAAVAPDCLPQRLIELGERLDIYDRDETVYDRPIGAQVAQICKALSIRVDWTRWELEDWACEEATTRAPGSPYAAHLIKRHPPPPDDPDTVAAFRDWLGEFQAQAP